MIHHIRKFKLIIKQEQTHGNVDRDRARRFSKLGCFALHSLGRAFNALEQYWILVLETRCSLERLSATWA
jgi:hypothetical protein